MAKRKEETRHWKRCRDGKLAHEKNATACATGETHVTTTARYRHAPVAAAKIKNGDDARRWRGRGQGCGRGGAASCTRCWRARPAAPPLGKTAARCLTELNARLPCTPESTLAHSPRNGDSRPHENLSTAAHSSFIRHGQKPGTTRGPSRKL